MLVLPLAFAALPLLASATSVITSCKVKNAFALTFDDGPYSNGVSSTNTLESYGGKGTFFVNGNNWDSWGHDDITTLTTAQLNKQIDLVETALKKILGIKPRYFRPPYGSYDAKSLAVLAKRGYTVVTWDFDSADSAGATSDQIRKNYEPFYKKPLYSHLALNHETYSTTPVAMQYVVPELVKAGYKLVSVADCLGGSYASKPYQSVGKASRRDKTWTCVGTPGPGEA
ncbi:Carbohydrate esterase family 4 protein [Pseudohyphozyma bogoriensis]|nr:Carbohydrate esterase family 4 protein [Pseudohyphozyma bogoriensis]